MADFDAETLADQAVMIGLLTREQVRRAQNEAEDGSLDSLLRALMRKGHLTSWQRDKLLKGDLNGFMFGDCRVMFHLAEGTFARVYRGQRVNGEQSVAIKVLRRRFTTDQAAVNRFLQEAESGLKLIHPNIVRILDFGEADKNHYMVMEYVEGSNLRDFLKIRKTLSATEALPLMIGLAQGLKYSFDSGVTHRDIKATNILIASKGEAKLVDFGLATIDLGDFSSSSNETARTVDYSALERSCGSFKGDPRSDIYFLGCVYYQMLTGTPAMAETETSDPLAKMLKRSFGAIKPLSEHRNAPPAELCRIIEKMMKIDLKSRYQNMDDVVNDLIAYRDSGAARDDKAPRPSSGTIKIRTREPERKGNLTGDDLFAAAFGHLPDAEDAGPEAEAEAEATAGVEAEAGPRPNHCPRPCCASRSRTRFARPSARSSPRWASA